MDRHRRSAADRESSATDELVRRSNRPSFDGRVRAQHRAAAWELGVVFPTARLWGASLHRDGRPQLAQRQMLRALALSDLDAKADKTASAAAPSILMACANVRSALDTESSVQRRHVECGKPLSECPAVDRQPHGPAQATEPDRCLIRFFSNRTEDRSRTRTVGRQRGRSTGQRQEHEMSSAR